MSISDTPSSNGGRYRVWGPVGDRFARLSQLMAENGMTNRDGNHSQDERMLEGIAYAYTEALGRIESFTSPDKWAVERLITIKETLNGPVQVLRRPQIDMSIGYTAKQNLCVEWQPRWHKNNDAEFGDFRFRYYDIRRQPFQRPFFETFYLAGFGDYVRGIKNAQGARRFVKSEIARLAIECATEIMDIASRTCDVRLDGRLKEVLIPGTEIIDHFHYENLESIEMKERDEKDRRLAEQKAEFNREIGVFEKQTGVSARWFCDNVARLRHDGFTFGAIARSLNELGGPIEFTKGSLTSFYRDLTRKIDIVTPGWQYCDYGRPHLVVRQTTLPKPEPTNIKKGTDSSAFLSKVSRRIADHQEKVSRATPRDALAPDYTNLTRYKKADAGLAELGLGSVDELVDRINEMRATSGRLPVPQGSFPSNKASFEKLVREFASHDDGLKPGL